MEKPFDESVLKLTGNNEVTTFVNSVTDNFTSKNKITWFTYISAFTANLLVLSLGIFYVWSSPVIPKLQSNNTDINPLGIPVTTLQISIIASTPFICAIIGFLVTAQISNKLGRRRMLIYSSLCIAPTLIALAFAKHIYVYYICLGLLGFLFSGGSLNAIIYNIEIAENSNRGKIGCLTGVCMPIGALCGYAFGPVTSIKLFTLIIATPLVLILLISPFLVESPVYLAYVGKRTEALSSLKKLRRPRTYSEIKTEIRNIEDFVKLTNQIQKGSYLKLFKSRVSRKSLLLSLIICISQQLSGITVILGFAAPIFNAAGLPLSGNEVGILIGFVMVFFFFIACYCVDKFGRRQLLLLSSLSSALSMLALAIYFYIKQQNFQIANDIRWFPLLSIIIFIVGYSLGLGPIPLAMIPELFDTRFRTYGKGAAYVIDSFVIFIMLFVFPIFQEAYGVCYSMLFYSLAEFVGFILIYFLLPETKNKTLSEIQGILRN